MSVFKANGQEYKCKSYAKRREYYIAKAQKIAYWNKLRRKFGLSKDGYYKLLQDQNYGCAVCLKPTDLAVDHDHVTNKVRGILCRTCNFIVGYIEKQGYVVPQMHRFARYIKCSFSK